MVGGEAPWPQSSPKMEHDGREGRGKAGQARLRCRQGDGGGGGIWMGLLQCAVFCVWLPGSVWRSTLG